MTILNKTILFSGLILLTTYFCNVTFKNFEYLFYFNLLSISLLTYYIIKYYIDKHFISIIKKALKSYFIIIESKIDDYSCVDISEKEHSIEKDIENIHQILINNKKYLPNLHKQQIKFEKIKTDYLLKKISILPYISNEN